MTLSWFYSQDTINWQALSNLYKVAPLGDKKPADLETAFSNSLFKCFVFDDGQLVAAGRVLADGVDCAYICDIAARPSHQGVGLGKAIVTKLLQLSAGHKKIILYTAPGKEAFYKKLGFKRMTTAMAIFQNQEQALANGLVSNWE